MTLTIVRHEIRNQVRDGRFRWSAAAVLLVLLFSVLTGLDQQRRLVAEREEVSRVMRQQWLEQGEKNPHSAAHFSIYAFRTPFSLALFDRGVEPYTGSAIWLEAHYQNEAVYAPARDATSLGRFGQLTTAATLQLLVPLLVVVLGAGAIAGERERGSLALVASQGVAPRRLAFGKALGTACALALLLVPAAALGGLALSAAGGTLGSSGGAARAAGIAAGYLVYFGIFLGLTIAVSSFAAGVRPALLVLLAVWVVNALAAARVATLAADRLSRLPTWHALQTAIEADKRLGIDGHNPVGERAEALERRLLAEYDVDSLDDLPVDFSGIALQEDEEYGARVYDQHYGELRRIYAEQDRVHLVGGALAPALAIRDLSMALAGSDAAHHWHFADAAEAYRRDLVRTLNEEIIYSSRRAYEENFAGRELWERIPDFAYAPPPASWAYAGQGGRIAVLVLWLLAGAVLAAGAASRFRLES